MFKKRTAKKRNNDIQLIGREPTDTVEEKKDDDILEQAEAAVFRKRDLKAGAHRLNKMSTAVQDTTSKDFLGREVQDLTNNYKSSSKARQMQ